MQNRAHCFTKFIHASLLLLILIGTCKVYLYGMCIFVFISQGEDLDFAYDSISAFSTRRDNQEAVFGTEEGLKEIR